MFVWGFFPKDLFLFSIGWVGSGVCVFEHRCPRKPEARSLWVTGSCKLPNMSAGNQTRSSASGVLRHTLDCCASPSILVWSHSGDQATVNLLKSSCLGFPSAEIPDMYQHIWKDIFHISELCKQPEDCGARDSRWLFFFLHLLTGNEENKSLESSRMFKLYDKV